MLCYTSRCDSPVIYQKKKHYELFLYEIIMYFKRNIHFFTDSNIPNSDQEMCLGLTLTKCLKKWPFN